MSYPLSDYQQTYKQTVIDFFNNRTRYNNELTIRRALPLLELVPLKAGQHVLDVATGTGIIAIAAAQAIGPTGKITGIDFSASMLHQAQAKITALNLHNIELLEADAEHQENPIAQLSPEQLDSLVQAYRQEVVSQATDQGIWYESLAYFVVGQKL